MEIDGKPIFPKSDQKDEMNARKVGIKKTFEDRIEKNHKF
jgi:hypothetical protein